MGDARDSRSFTEQQRDVRLFRLRRNQLREGTSVGPMLSYHVELHDGRGVPDTGCGLGRQLRGVSITGGGPGDPSRGCAPDFSRSGKPTEDPNGKLFYGRPRAEWLNVLVDE